MEPPCHIVLCDYQDICSGWGLYPSAEMQWVYSPAELFVSDRNTWYHKTVWKQMTIIDK